MRKVTDQEIKQWARLGSRGVYGQTILELAQTNENLIALSADLGNSSGLDRFRQSFPERFVNVGIAEQNLVGVAAGIAKEGLTVFASSFAPFLSMRASEQIRMNLGYMGLNVKLVSIGSGLAMGFLGNSHFGLEDVAVMRTIPGLTIVSPADCTEVVKVIHAAAEFSGPMYIRLTGVPNSPTVYENDYTFSIGKAITLREGEDLAIIATGSGVAIAKGAAQLLESSGITTEVINFHTIKPLDFEVLSHLGRRFTKICVIEEHSIIGGLTSAIAQHYSVSESAPTLLPVTLPDAFGPTAEYGHLLDYYGFTVEKVAEKVLKFLGK